MKKIILPISILLGLIILGIFIYYSQVRKNDELEQQKAKELEESRRNICVERVIKELKEINAATMETRDITNFRIWGDRGCFIEAGGEKGVKDEYFHSKYDEYNDGYYSNCRASLMVEVEKRIEEEKLKRINLCLKLYSE